MLILSRHKTFSILTMFLLIIVSVNSQTRKLKPLDRITIDTPSAGQIKQLIPKTLFFINNTDIDDDSVSIAEILFNPEIKLIDPDTFKLETSYILPDSSLQNRDSSRIIDVHAQDVVQSNVFKIETKDKNAFIVIYGSIRVNGATDYNGLQSVSGFNTYFIPVGDANSNVRRFFMSASQTRFGIQGTNKTDYGPINFRIEGDFRGSSSNSFRIRHAYGQFINILAGQTWSVFGDPFSIPWTVDIEGPNSSVNQRAVQIRYSNLIDERFRWTASVEAPQIDYFSDTINIYQGTPDLAGRLKFMTRWGHLQASFILRSLGVRNTIDQPSSSMGIGGLLSGRIDLTHNAVVMFQMVGGRGISRYITTLKGTGNDLILNPETGLYEPLPVFGGFVSFGYGWKPNLYSYLTPGFTSVKNLNFQPDDAFSYSGYFSVNTFWDVTKGFRVGAEYSFGSRVNNDNEFGTANRISFIIYYSF